MKPYEIPDIDYFNPYKDLPDEKWADIDYADKLYKISNYGRVKSYALKETGVILRNRKAEDYIITEFLTMGVKKKVFVHKLVAEYFIPNDDKSKTKVIHIDNDRRNNHYENLKWVNQKECYVHSEKFNENLLNKFRLNKVSNAKVTREEVEEIRKMIEEGVLQKVIAEKFKISEMQITRIKRKENWKPRKERKIVYSQKILPKKIKK